MNCSDVTRSANLPATVLHDPLTLQPLGTQFKLFLLPGDEQMHDMNKTVMYNNPSQCNVTCTAKCKMLVGYIYILELHS